MIRSPALGAVFCGRSATIESVVSNRRLFGEASTPDGKGESLPKFRPETVGVLPNEADGSFCGWAVSVDSCEILNGGIDASSVGGTTSWSSKSRGWSENFDFLGMSTF